MNSAEEGKTKGTPTSSVEVERVGKEQGEYLAVQVDCYDSMREIKILAYNTTGSEWTALKTAIKIAVGMFLEQ